MPSQVVRVDQLRSLAAGGISGTYAAIGTPLSHPMRLVKLTNNTDGDLTISFDAIGDNLFLPKGSFTLFDLTTNRGVPDGTFVFEPGTTFYAKGTATTGSVYLEAIFGQGE